MLFIYNLSAVLMTFARIVARLGRDSAKIRIQHEHLYPSCDDSIWREVCQEVGSRSAHTRPKCHRCSACVTIDHLCSSRPIIPIPAQRIARRSSRECATDTRFTKGTSRVNRKSSVGKHFFSRPLSPIGRDKS